MTPGLLRAEERVIHFAAHPDDETIGAGGQLPFLENAWIVHATDGAPRNMLDARNHGFTSRKAYAGARRAEFLAALQLAGFRPDRTLKLDFADQECSRQLPELVCRVSVLLREMQPDAVLVPPYEGGHPDHDSLAFAVHFACRFLKQPEHRAPRIVEYALYHGGSGHLTAGDFLPPPQAGVVTVTLSEPVASLKRRMLECFTTQRATLAPFATDCERFRLAPDYDFTVPPHPGTLYYENFDWGVTGEQWRQRAVEAALSLKVDLC